MRAFAAAATLGALVVGAATAASARPERADTACRLLKSREIAAAFSAEVGRGHKGASGPTCIWVVAGGSRDGGGEIGTFLQRGSSAREAFGQARAFAAGDEVPVEDLGRDAFFVKGLDTLYVLEGKRTLFYVQGVFLVADLKVDVTDLDGKLAALAQIASERA